MQEKIGLAPAGRTMYVSEQVIDEMVTYIWQDLTGQEGELGRERRRDIIDTHIAGSYYYHLVLTRMKKMPSLCAETLLSQTELPV